MNLGFDLDEVIAKTAHMSVSHLNEIFECDLDIEVFENFWFRDNTYDEDERINTAAVQCLEWSVKDARMLSSVEPYPEAIKVLNIFRKMGHKIFIVTKREKYLKEDTVKWLHTHKIPFDKLIVTNHEPKSTFARKYRLDCFVDDLEENLEELYKNKATWKKGLMLMSRPWNVNRFIDKSKFIRVDNWNDVLKVIQVQNRFKT